MKCDLTSTKSTLGRLCMLLICSAISVVINTHSMIFNKGIKNSRMQAFTHCFIIFQLTLMYRYYCPT